MTEAEAARRLVQIHDNIDSLRITLENLAELAKQSSLDSGRDNAVIAKLQLHYESIMQTLLPIRVSFGDCIHTLIHSS